MGPEAGSRHAHGLDHGRNLSLLESDAPLLIGLPRRGVKRNGGRSPNTRGEDNVSPQRLVIAVNDGQGMLVVQKRQDHRSRAGARSVRLRFPAASRAGVFSGNLGDSIQWRPSPISAAALPSAATRARPARLLYQHQGRSSVTSTAPPRPCPSAWSTTILAWTSTSPCAATAVFVPHHQPAAVSTPNVCSNVTDSYTRDKIDSQRSPSCSPPCSPPLPRFRRWASATAPSPAHHRARPCAQRGPLCRLA